MNLTKRMGAIARGRTLLARQTVTNLAERMRRMPWPQLAAEDPGQRVAALVVNYNGLEHMTRLLFSLFRVLDSRLLYRVIVVDNGSTDGSLAFLSAFEQRRLIRLVRNVGPPYHGPGLNRGMSYLATLQRDRDERLSYIWVLDSDVIMLRPDALDAAVHAISEQRGALAGQLQFDVPILPEGYAHVSSNLFDPVQVWRRGIPPFLEHGAPGVRMQRRLRDRGATIVDFPFYRGEYMLHLGLGTLSVVARRGERRNRYYRWAVELASPEATGVYHFHGNPRGSEWLIRFQELLKAEVPALEPEPLVDACLRPERVRL